MLASESLLSRRGGDRWHTSPAPPELPRAGSPVTVPTQLESPLITWCGLCCAWGSSTE